MRPIPVVLFVGIAIGGPAWGQNATPTATAGPATVNSPLAAILIDELDHTMKSLTTEDGTKPYYVAYTATDISSVVVAASLGALENRDADRSRLLDVDLRVGSYELDNTREIRGGRGGGFDAGGAARGRPLPLEDDALAIQHALWRATDRAFDAALERLKRVQTNMKTTVREETEVPDFSKETPSVYQEPRVELNLDLDAWATRVRRLSRVALAHPLIYDSSVTLAGTAENRVMVSSEGARVITGRKLIRVIVSAATKAEDGMELSQSQIFDAASESGLPSDAEIQAAFEKVIATVLGLRAAPLVEPFTGPAILMNRASGVFFHEIFGHRIEGHRQKSAEEGQTFTKMVSKPVLPEFLSVIDDPTRAQLGAQDLRGFYRYDDEGIPAQRVDLVKDGLLRTFLLSRSPLEGHSQSNGHGRREPGREAVSRQGNLMVESTRTVPIEKLREMLREECRKQARPFGYVFEDITGGFTTTTRGGPQAFKVLPVVVWRVYADGRADELVRGVDIVGTPLSCFSKIICTGDDPAVFNGSCGAESGWVPVSAVSPSILVEQIEIEKRERSQSRLPILQPPVAEQPVVEKKER
ncbi:MAG: metallopeptidase TldD-related protein [Planctomycetota bacterium]